jgi:hypothetical protein
VRRDAQLDPATALDPGRHAPRHAQLAAQGLSSTSGACFSAAAGGSTGPAQAACEQQPHPQQPARESPGGQQPPRNQQQQPASWLERVLPASALPYAHLMRLDKPIGTYLLAWPGLWWVRNGWAPPAHPKGIP